MAMPDPTPPPDPVAAYLEQARSAAAPFRFSSAPEGRLAGYLLHAAAAVEAVLRPHQPGRIVIMGALCAAHEAHRHFSITGTEAQAVRDCPECAGEPFVICTGCAGATAFTDCPVRKVVAVELLGEGKPDGT